MKKTNLIDTWLEIGSRNAWIVTACDPAFSHKSFYECKNIEDLQKQFSGGNWCLGQAFYYKNICFINQIDGGDEWLTIKDDLAFESITMKYYLDITVLSNLIDRILKATKEDCRRLRY